MARNKTPDEWAGYAKSLGLNIQRHRIAAQLTQEQVAYAAGLTRSHYQQMEKGLSRQGTPANPTLLTLVGLSQVLQVSLADLLPEGAPDIRAGR